ncbi:MAG: glycosyltransferase family 4 protein [Actinomycetota bacterium]
MKIGLTSPYAHPYVWRGAERYLHELAEWLAGRGHVVTIATTAPDSARDEAAVPGVTIRYRLPGKPFGWGPLRVDELLRTVPCIARGVRDFDTDVIQCHGHADAFAARLGTLGRRVPYVMWVPGAPRRARFTGRPLHWAAFRIGVAGAARIHSLSRFAARALKEEFGVASQVVPPGVRTELYQGPKPRTGEPLVLCAAAPEDPRKRVEVLVRAFPLLLREVPNARLALAAPRAEEAERMLDCLDAPSRARAEVRTGLDARSLAELYRTAHVSVLPSVDEAFGLVMVESLAAGTPVVGADHGAIPEVIDDPSIGRLFPPDDGEALARKLVEVIEMAEDPETAVRCRAAAGCWDWSRVGPDLEATYADLAN